MVGATRSMDGPILKVEHLSMKFGGLVAIGDLSFEARRGEITALIGPNGAGKTTVFNCITGFYKPTEGMITLTGSKGGTFLLERMPDHEITARAKVARTFQNIRLFSGMTLLENLLVAQHNKLMRASGFTVLGLLGLRSYQDASRASIELARHWLEKAKLVDRADDPAGDLPYGAQRRLEIARAMCTGPELLCLDEPAAGLNPRESAELNTLLNDIKDTTGTSILLIEHDMSVVMQISDHVVVLEYGRKISDGDPTHVKNDPRVIAAYLGVEDEEVVDVLTEVGDDTVLEGLEGHPDTLHGPQSSSSMLAGSVMDTIEHDDPGGERITVSPNASRGGRTKAGTEAPAAGRDDEAAARLGAAAALGAGSGAGGAAATGTSAGGRKTAKAAAAALGGSAGAGAGKGAAAAAPARKEAGAPAAAISGKLPAPRGGRPDDLLAIKGIGPVNQRKLNEHGIFHFDQIAAWTQDDIAAVEAYLAFDGRIAREDWIGQARRLAADAAASPEKPKRGGRT